MFGPYPDYRRTDLKWFEHLPDSWAILRTKQMFRLVIEKAPVNNKMELLSVYTHIGVRPRKSLEQRGNKASTTDGYWVVKEGDIICNKLLAWMGAIGVSHYQGVTSPAYDILRPIKSCNTDYYHFLFRTKKYLQQFKIRSRGIMDMRLRLYFDQFGQIPIPVPPRHEQDQIVAYGFLAAILSYGHSTWEMLSIFLNFLIPKLPAPKEEDLSKGVLETIDMDSYRVEAKAALKMAMDNADASIEPVPPGGGGGRGEADIDKLSAIIKTFNDLFGNIEWKDEDKIRKVIAEEIPARVAQDKAYQNAQANSDKQNAKLEHDKALNRVVLELLSDHTELFKQFSDNPNFKRWLTDTVFDATYQQGAIPPKAPPQTGASA